MANFSKVHGKKLDTSNYNASEVGTALEVVAAENLGHRTDAEILQATEQLASDVRRINAEFLRYLREVEGRRLYLALGYPSLYEYCVKALKLSEGSASRRIGAMRLIRDLPKQGGGEILQAVEEGRVNLSTLSTLQRFVNQEAKLPGAPRRYSPEQKQALVKEMEGRSQVECEVRLAEISPQSVPLREKERVLTPVLTEVKFVMSEELKQKLERIRELDSHQANPHPTYAELFLRMADRVLKQIDPERPRPERKFERRLERKPEQKSVGEPEQKPSENPDIIARTTQPIPRAKHQERTEPENKISKISTLPAASAAPMASVQQWSSLVQSALARAQAQTSSSSAPNTLQIFIHSDFLSSPRKRSSSGSFKKTTFPERPSRAIPAALRRAVWTRDHGACTFTSSSPSLRSLAPLLHGKVLPTP